MATMSFWSTLLYYIVRIFWRFFKVILAVAFTAFFIILLFQTLLFTIPVLGFATLPFSNNYNSLVQGAFNQLGFVGNSWNTLTTSLNPFLLCLADIPNATNVVMRFLLAFAAIFVQAFNVIASENVQYPSWWNARNADGSLAPFNLHDGAVAFQAELLRIDRGRDSVIAAEFRSFGYERMEDALPHVRLKALEAGSRYVRAEYARAFGDFIPDFICSLINGVSDLFTSVINLFAPFALDFMSLIVQAIEAGEAGNEGEFILLLVEMIFTEVLNQLGFGQCITDIPNSLIQCLFPTCNQPTITDISALIFACIFQPVCTTNEPQNAGDVVFQCLHIQSIIDFGLSVYNAILSLQSVAQSIADFFVGLYNSLKSLQSVVNDVYAVLQKIASKFGVSLRAVVTYESAYSYLDRIGIVLGLQRPYATRGGEYATLYALYRAVNGTEPAAIDGATVDNLRSFYVGNVTRHRREMAPRAVVDKVADLLRAYFDERLLAIQRLHENYVAAIHLPRDNPTVLADLRAYDALLQDELSERVARFDESSRPPPVLSTIGNVTLIPGAFLFNNTDLHLAVAALTSLRDRIASNGSANVDTLKTIRMAREAKASLAPYGTTPVWQGEPTFGARFARMMDVTAPRFNGTLAYQQMRWITTFFANDTHYRKLHAIATMVDDMAGVVRWGLRFNGSITMPELHRRTRHIDGARGLLALHALSHDVARARGDIFITPDRARQARHVAARWAGLEVFERMVNRTSATASERGDADRHFHERVADILDERQRIAQNHDVFDLQRMSIIVSIVGGAVSGTAIWSGAPVAIVASLIPTLAAVIVPLLGLLTTSLPAVLGYLSQKVQALITNAFAGGAYVAPDLFTNLMLRIGSTLASMFTLTPSPFAMTALFSQTIEWAQDAMNDVEMFVLYTLASFLPPFPFQSAIKPTKDDTPSVYFSKLIFTNVDAPCITHADCVGGYCRRLVDIHDPAGCAMMCTSEAPCSPPGNCVASPLYVHWNGCLQGAAVTVTFDVDCTQSGYPYNAGYLTSPSFVSHGMSITFLFSRDGLSFVWNAMDTAFVALRNVIRLISQGIMLPIQSLMSGAVSAIPLVPGIFTWLRAAAAVLYLVGEKLQTFALNIFPTLNWLDRHLWFINWFGLPSPFLGIANLFRFPNYAEFPPVGKALPGDYMCPVLEIAPLLIGVFCWIIVLGLVYALIFGGILALLFDVLFLIIFPFLYVWHVAGKANTARELNEMGAFDAQGGSAEDAARISPTWYDASRESIGARIPTAVTTARYPRLSPWGAMWPTIRACVTNGDFAARIMSGLPVPDSAHVVHPHLRLPLRHSSPLFVVPRSASR